MYTCMCFVIIVLWRENMRDNAHVHVDKKLKRGLCFILLEGMYQCPRRPGRSPDGQCLLGTVLSGTWNPARRSDAQ